MLNFLPQKNRKRIISEYLLRVSVFLLIFIFASSVVLISLFAPSYFFVEYKNNTIKNQLASIQQKDINGGEDPIAFIKDVNQLSVVLAGNNNSRLSSFGDIINKIVSLKNDDIKISSINITETNDTGGKTILVNGIANTRDSLTAFDQSIKSDGSFSSVMFPVSDFILSSNSEFSATLIL